MSYRDGMGPAVNRLRLECNAGTVDFTVNGTSYFTDDQLALELDRYAIYLTNVMLIPAPKLLNGQYQYFDFVIPAEVGRDFEQAGTTSKFTVKDLGGVTIPSSQYSVNYDNRIISFTTDQKAVYRILDIMSFDMYKSCAEVYRQKANLVAHKIDWSSDNMRINASMLYKQYMEMADEYEAKAGPTYSRFSRVDENKMPLNWLGGVPIDPDPFAKRFGR